MYIRRGDACVPGGKELRFGFSGGGSGGGTWIGNGTNAAVSNAFVHFCLHVPLFVVHELAVLWQRHFLKGHRRRFAGGTVGFRPGHFQHPFQLILVRHAAAHQWNAEVGMFLRADHHGHG